jgi:hypothetical protein
MTSTIPSFIESINSGENLSQLLPIISLPSVEDQYALNKLFYDSKDKPELIQKLLNQGVPYANSELYQYGNEHQGAFNLRYYSGSILRDYARDCLKSKKFETLFMLIESNQWTPEISTQMFYECIVWGQDKKTFEIVFNKIIATHPTYLNDITCEKIYSHTAFSNKLVTAADVREIVGYIPDNAHLVFWACKDQFNISKIETAIHYYKHDFPDSYKDKINAELTLYCKAVVINNPAQLKHIEKLSLEYEQTSVEWRFYALKELIKKYKTEKNSSTYHPIIYEHLEYLVKDKKLTNTLLTTNMLTKNSDLFDFIKTSVNYINLSNSTPVNNKSGKKKNKI